MRVKVNALLIDSDIERRTRLRQVLSFAKLVDVIKAAPTLDRGYSELNSAERFEAVFVSNQFGQENIAHFIKRAKGAAQGRDCAYIIVLSTADQSAGAVSGSVADGIDGVLLEPFSAESLNQVLDLAVQLTQRRLEARQRAAARLLSKDILAQTDKVALAKVRGQSPGTDLQLLRRLGQSVRGLGEDVKQFYFDALQELSEQARPFASDSDRGGAPLPPKVERYEISQPSLLVRPRVGDLVPEFEVSVQFAGSRSGDLNNSLLLTRSSNGGGELVGSTGDRLHDELLVPVAMSSGLTLEVTVDNPVDSKRSFSTLAYGLGSCLRELDQGVQRYGFTMARSSQVEQPNKKVAIQLENTLDHPEARLSFERSLLLSKDKDFLLQRSAMRSMLSALAEGGGYSIEACVDHLTYPQDFVNVLSDQLGKALQLCATQQ